MGRFHGNLLIHFSLVITFFCVSALAAEPTAGFVTFYSEAALIQDSEKNFSGACGYGSMSQSEWPYGNFVSLGSNNSIVLEFGSNRYGCGECIRAKCLGEGCVLNAEEGVTLWVTDECSSCKENQLNVPSSVFLKYFGVSRSLGQVNVTYEQVECNPPDTIKIKVVRTRATLGGYMALVIMDVSGSGKLVGVDLKSSASSKWLQMENLAGNVWELSQFGQPPFDVRITTFEGFVLIASEVITNISIGTYSTTVQAKDPPAITPASNFASSPGPEFPTLTLPPVSGNAPEGVNETTSAQQSASGRPVRHFAPEPPPAPKQSLFEHNIPTKITLSGIRIDSPLYFAPEDSSSLLAYQNYAFDYTECSSNPPLLKIVVDKVNVPTISGGYVQSWTIQSLLYFAYSDQHPDVYKLQDLTYFNLETGVFASVVDPQIITFKSDQANFSDSGSGKLVSPIFLNFTQTRAPEVFQYKIVLPPAANEQPSETYLDGLKEMYYYLSVLTMGNNGTLGANLSCSEGYSNMGPWADYLRYILAELAPASKIQGDLYDNIPLGSGYAFRDNSFVISNAIIQGEVTNSSSQLSSKDCSALCHSTSSSGSNGCSAWSWCASIVGCNSVPYNTCLLKDALILKRTGDYQFLDISRNSSTRFISGTLVLPSPLGFNLSNTS